MKKLVLNSFLIIEYGDIVIGTDAIKAIFYNMGIGIHVGIDAS